MININPKKFKEYEKSLVIAKNGMVASSHPIASYIGLEILRNGGNAVDAALAMNGVLCIAEPHMTGLGGDCFVMLSVDGSTNIKALNGSGRSSENTSSKKLRSEGNKIIAPNMPEAITIPGAVAAWSLLHNEHGYMPWKELFSHSIHYATFGIQYIKGYIVDQ